MPVPENNFDLDNWSTQLRKGLLEMCILNLLAQGELYGYDLVKSMTALHGLVVSEGTIYPLLSRFRKAGLVETRLEESLSGPARRYYRLSPQGRRMRKMMNEYWDRLAADVQKLQRKGESGHE